MDATTLSALTADPVRLAALAAVFLLALALVALLFLSLGRRIGSLEAGRHMRKQEEGARGDAVKRSRAVLTGQIGEQLAPFLPGFPGDPADARFLGKPVDFIVFSGLSTGLPTEIVFVEVKSGEARLSATEKALKEAVLAGRVRWMEYRLPV
jgi:predicted Holliday junction resolvase-like endonuclease